VRRRRLPRAGVSAAFWRSASSLTSYTKALSRVQQQSRRFHSETANNGRGTMTGWTVLTIVVNYYSQ
jgi:hypothetical protein